MINSPIKKMNMIILMEHDLEAAVAFYKSLGIECKFHMAGKWAEFNLGNVNLGLCPTQQEPFDRRTGVVLEIENIQQFYDDHKESIAFLEEPFVAVHGIMVSVKDPGGNVFDLYQPTPEKVKDLADKVAQKCGDKKSSCGDCPC